MKKRFVSVTLITVIFVVMLSCFASCGQDTKTSMVSYDQASSYDLTTRIGSAFSYVAMVDGGVIYFTFSNNYTGGYDCTFYRYYIEEDRSVEIGKINDFVISGRSSALVNNILYFYVGVKVKDAIVNNLYGINLTEDTMSVYTQDTYSQHAFTIFSYQDSLITLKGNDIEYESNLSSSTFFETYDVADNTMETLIEKKMDYRKKQGKIFLSFCCDDAYIYALLYDAVSGSILNIYDNKFNLIKSINIDNIKDILQAPITEMAVMGEYIYIYNYSNQTVIGKLLDNRIEPLLQDSNVELSNERSINDPNSYVFYKRLTNKCYVLDSKKGEITTIPLQIKNDFTITYALAEKDKMIVILSSENNDRMMYYVNKTNLGETVFDCELLPQTRSARGITD